MALLVTGASGFVGSALIPKLLEKGHKVYGLSRHPPEAADNLIPLVGDVTERNLGLIEMEPLKGITAVYHLAGIMHLGEDKDGSVWRTNVEGTRNVLEFCARHDIPHLYFASTAYTRGRNAYERSKAYCELLIKQSDIHVTIFKPSIIMGVPEHPYPGHFSQFVTGIIKVHHRAEIIRRRVEGSLRLPVIVPLFRIKGNPGGKLNLIQVDQVVWGIANCNEIASPLTSSSTLWLTHPSPPTLKQLCGWVGEFIMVDLRTEPEFKATPIEAVFHHKAAAFIPYLQGDDFPSNLQLSPPITREFIQDTIKQTVLD